MYNIPEERWDKIFPKKKTKSPILESYKLLGFTVYRNDQMPDNMFAIVDKKRMRYVACVFTE